MSTRCLIGLKKGSKVEFIYCHHDGYVKGGVGEILETYYKDPKTVQSLMKLGDLSCLGTKPIRGDWNKPLDDEKCLAYKDRGEEGVDAKICNDDEYPTQHLMLKYGVDYIYLFDNVWFRWNEYNGFLEPVEFLLYNN